MTSNTAETAPTSPRRKKRQPIIAFGLAALAIGGIGAAATSAAWSDNTWFSAPAAAATFNLQGSLDGTTWLDGTQTTVGDVTTYELAVPATTFANLLPGQTRNVNLWVRNDSSVNAVLTSEVAFANGSTFVTKPTPALSGLAASLTAQGTAGATDQFQLALTTPAAWDPANIGKSGTVVVTLTATATS
jgi:predicted ribosomally synthesized peptide with SipW-like signal peptide